jgi:hypothetical protein
VCVCVCVCVCVRARVCAGVRACVCRCVHDQSAHAQVATYETQAARLRHAAWRCPHMHTRARWPGAPHPLVHTCLMISRPAVASWGCMLSMIAASPAGGRPENSMLSLMAVSVCGAIAVCCCVVGRRVWCACATGSYGVSLRVSAQGTQRETEKTTSTHK